MMSGLRLSNDLLNPVTYIQKAHFFFSIYEITLHKVIAVAVLALTVATGLAIVGIVQSLKRSLCVDLTFCRQISNPPPAPGPEDNQALQVVEIKPGEEFQLLQLPDDLIKYVLSFLNVKGLLTLELVSKRIRELATHDILWNPLAVRYHDFLWNPASSCQWEAFFKKTGKSWKQIYQEIYEGSVTTLKRVCCVQSFPGIKQKINFTDRSTCQQLMWHICEAYELPLETNIVLQVSDEVLVPENHKLVKNVVSIPGNKETRLINFTVRPEQSCNPQNLPIEAPKSLTSASN